MTSSTSKKGETYPVRDSARSWIPQTSELLSNHKFWKVPKKRLVLHLRCGDLERLAEIKVLWSFNRMNFVAGLQKSGMS